MLTDQAAALARVEELVDAELWRADRRAVALGVLRGLVCGMAWSTTVQLEAAGSRGGRAPGVGVAVGLVAGVTRAHLAAGAGCSPRTVSRVIAWAVEAGLVVCVETGATAEFLGTEANRAPSYVLTAPVDWALSRRPWQARGGEALEVDERSARAGSVDEVGNPPASCVDQVSPRRDRGFTDHHQRRHNQDPAGSRRRSDTAGRVTDGVAGAGWPPGWPPGWPVFDRATTPRERAAAVDTLLERAGLGARVVRWRAVALLGPWLEAGWCVAGLLHALDHHPGAPHTSRGDAAHAARDPLAVLGHRLRPWRGRLDELPGGYAAVDGTARRRRAAALAAHAERPDTPSCDAAPNAVPEAVPGQSGRPVELTAAARSAREQIGRVLDRRRARPCRARSW